MEQIISTAKLLVLSKSLKKRLVNKGLVSTDTLSQQQKKITNLCHFWESNYQCAESESESVVRRCIKKDIQSEKTYRAFFKF